MTENQKELFNRLIKMPVGTTLRKGQRQRILVGLAPGMIVYKTKADSPKTIMENISNFMKWAEKAEIITE